MTMEGPGDQAAPQACRPLGALVRVWIFILNHWGTTSFKAGERPAQIVLLGGALERASAGPTLTLTRPEGVIFGSATAWCPDAMPQ